MTTDFSTLGLSERTVASLTELGFTVPTEVQEKTLGLVMEGVDVIASAHTGSGKTAAFALPVIERFGSPTGRNRKIRALVLVPTRELALQVKSEFERLSRGLRLRFAAFYGGTGYGAQIRAVQMGLDIAICTPGRLNDLLERGLVSLSQVEYLVLDEADRMLDMGFAPQVRRIVDQMPEQRQTLMFTATLDRRVESLARDYMKQPKIVRCKQDVVAPSEINQQMHRVPKRDKEQLLLRVLAESEEATVLVFTRTRHTASKLTERLRAANVQAEEIHGDINQNRRERTIARYRDGLFNVLVATDIAARGLDVPSITHVVNFDLPDCAADYVHRIGRTGRAGRAGVAHSFISEDQLHLARAIEQLVGKKFTPDGASSPRQPQPRQSQSRQRRFSSGSGGNTGRPRHRSDSATQTGARKIERLPEYLSL